MKIRVEQTPDKRNGKNVKDEADNGTLTNDNKDTNGFPRSNQTSSLEGSQTMLATLHNVFMKISEKVMNDADFVDNIILQDDQTLDNLLTDEEVHVLSIVFDQVEMYVEIIGCVLVLLVVSVFICIRRTFFTPRARI